MDEPIDADELCARVRTHRQGRGLSLRAAADEAGVPFNTLARVEKGDLPDLANFGRLMTWLGIEPSKFFRSTGRTRTDNTTDAIRATLRRDPYLTPEAAAQIADIVSNLYSTLASPSGGVDLHLRAHTTFTPAAARQLSTLLEEMRQTLLSDDALGDEPGWDG